MRRERDRLVRKIIETDGGRFQRRHRLQSMLDNRPSKLVEKVSELQSEHQSIGNDLDCVATESSRFEAKAGRPIAGPTLRSERTSIAVR